MTKISIIIPIYNTEKYLKQCLDSVINQTFKDIEIICVDDCGDDNSTKIIEDYIKIDERIKLVQHKKNKGLGPSRNTGIKNASGKFIFFLDSDDYLNKNTIEILYMKADETDSDIVSIRAEAFADDDSEETVKRTILMNNWLDKIELDNYQVNSDNLIDTLEEFNCTSWGKLYKKEFIINNKLQFIDGNFILEDNGFWIKILVNFPKISYVNYIGLMYRIRKNAITTEIDKKENRYKKSMHMKKILNDAFAYIDTCYPSKVSNQLIKDIKNSAYYSTFFEIKTWYLKFKWFKNDKRLTILGIPLLREKIKEHKYKIIRILGIKIYKKNINKNKDRLNILKER